LRIARKGAILGHGQLAAFAAEKAGGTQVQGPEAKPDPRAELYDALGSVASASIDDVAKRLAAIDRSVLSPRDIRLLDAATEVVSGVLAPPITPSAVDAAARPSDEPIEASPAAAPRPQAVAPGPNAVAPGTVAPGEDAATQDAGAPETADAEAPAPD
ncbi:chemotaxis protein MotC, partial [Rhizobiaceae sp. 2RAB30]